MRYGAGRPNANIAGAMGVARKCVATWVAYYEAVGKAQLHDRSSRPHTIPTAAEVETQIVELRGREGRTGLACSRIRCSGPHRLASPMTPPGAAPHGLANPMTGDQSTLGNPSS